MKEPITRYVEDRYAKLNEFISMQPDMSELPDFEKEKGKLPEPVWAGHDDEIAAYYKAWEIAFCNLGKPTKESGFVSPYIDAAFNGHIFMWDSCFMLMFGKYGDSVHCFQKTLDNFYCKQHKDGFICREINELDGVDRFYRHDPTSTGPEILAWCEWQYYKNYGDKDRLKKVYYPLLSFHHWLKNYHRWKDGSYWSSGWGCGMDNLPRCDLELIPDSEDWMLETFHHSYMSWIDATLQAAMSCEYLIMMAEELGISDDVDALKDEYDNLVRFVNEKMWSEKDGFYYDLRRTEASLPSRPSLRSGRLSRRLPRPRGSTRSAVTSRIKMNSTARTASPRSPRITRTTKITAATGTAEFGRRRTIWCSADSPQTEKRSLQKR